MSWLPARTFLEEQAYVRMIIDLDTEICSSLLILIGKATTDSVSNNNHVACTGYYLKKFSLSSD
jgi:hypothetical protein